MKIYFGFTVAGDRSTVETARQIVKWLEDAGHQVLTRHLVRDDARELDRALTPRAVYERDMQWLAACDVFIGEVSGSSFGMGYEAGFVLGGSRKPAILFHRADAANRISLLITGNSHPRCTVAAYTCFDEIAAVLSGALADGR
jgi:2'-deoxynucleoside 5'-phosphate N-hydrolase